MQNTIERRSISTLSYQQFREEFYLPEIPVILTDLEILADEYCNAEYIKDKYQDEDSYSLFWYRAEIPSPEDEMKIPSIVEGILKSDDTLVRNKPMRIWLQPKGNKTAWHFDASSIHVFNAQLKGTKDWVIVSPQTPLPTLPFSNVSAVKPGYLPTADKYDYYTFTTNPGEMLFLPRYWGHLVESLGATNINVNWVMTPTTPNLNNNLGRRECEVLKVGITKPYRPGGILSSIDEGGTQLIADYTKEISRQAARKRLIIELLKIPKTLFLLPKLISKTRENIKANFKVETAATK